MRRVLPTVRELFAAMIAVILALSSINLVRPAEAGSGGPSTDYAFVATGENFPDALGAAAAAGALLAPVLLVTQDSVPQATLDELNDLAPDQIIIVGGPAVISDGVKGTLESLGFAPTVIRLSGANRYETAAELSAAVFPTAGYYPAAAYSGGHQIESVNNTHEVVRSVTLTAPTDGTVIVNSTAIAIEATADDVVECSITTGTTLDNNFLQAWVSGGPGDGIYSQLSGTRGFAVSGGDEFTVNLVCAGIVVSGSSEIQDSSLTAIFIADI